MSEESLEEKIKFAKKLIKQGNKIYLWNFKLYDGCSRKGKVEDFSADLTNIKFAKLADAIREGEGEVGGKKALDLLNRILKAYDSANYYIENYKFSLTNPTLQQYCDYHMIWVSNQGMHIAHSKSKKYPYNIENCNTTCNDRKICPAYLAYKLSQKGKIELIHDKPL
jgi:hypothetical protein